MLCTQCLMHFSVFTWLSHLLLSPVPFVPSLQRCLRLVKQFQGTIGHFPRRTSFKKCDLISLILKDYVQEDCGEPVLITGPQALGRLPHRPGLAAPDQGPLYCSAHSGKPLLRPQPFLTFTHWTDVAWDQGLLTQSDFSSH